MIVTVKVKRMLSKYYTRAKERSKQMQVPKIEVKGEAGRLNKG
jgi:hypothetical protein